MGKITSKRYQCGTCGDIELIQTNHFGEIHSKCKKCYAGVRRCIEPEAIELWNSREKGSVKINFYRFNIRDRYEREDYFNLVDKLKEMDLKFFNVLAEPYGRTSTFLGEMKKRYDGKTVEIVDPNQFDNQFISEIGRLHEWYEPIYPNSDIKDGYYLTEITR